MAVPNPCLQNNWGEREMEDNRCKERVSCWADVELSDAGEEERDYGEVKEDVVNEEKEVNKKEGENERRKETEEQEEEMGLKEIVEIQDGKEVEKEIKENKQWHEDENRKQFKENGKLYMEEEKSNENRVARQENNMTKDEEKAVKKEEEPEGEEDEGGNEIQWKLTGRDVVEEEERKVEDVKTNIKEKEKQNGVEMKDNIKGEVGEKEVIEGEQVEEGRNEVDMEVIDEKKENKQWIDEEVKEEDNGEEHQEEDQIGEYDQGGQFREQIKRTEDENIHQNQDKSQDDESQNDSYSVDSIDNMDSDSTGCEYTFYNFECFKDEEQYLETQHPGKLQDNDECSLRNKNRISGTWSSKRRNEGEDSEMLTDEKTVSESQTTQKKECQAEEESTDDDEEEYFTDEDSNDEDTKLYSINHYHADVFYTLTQFKDSSLLTDLTLNTKDGHSFNVHSPVLAAVSSFVWGHLSKGTGKKDDDTRLHSWSVSLGPEVDHVGLGAVVEFAYTGLISRFNKDMVEQVKTAAQTLGVPRVLRLCTEEAGVSTQTAEQNKDGRISAAEQMMISLQSIKQLWMDRVGCDVILEALGEPLHIHRVILAATSDYFRGMFTLGMKESSQSCVILPFLLAPELEALISCSYSGTLPLSWKCVFEITVTALQLQYKPALTLCFNFLQQEMNPHSCLDVASFAEAYEMAQLLEIAEDFVLLHFQKVACTSKFKDLSAEQLLKYLRSHSLCVPSELVVFKAVVAWIQAKPKKRLKFAKELMEMIYFPLMTFKEFKEVQSLDMWSDHTELYETVFQDFCSNGIVSQSQCRIYMPKESLVLIGGDRISEDLCRRSISREIWFGNSLRNHTGIQKAMEWRKLGEMPESARFSHEVAVLKGQLYVIGGKKYYGTGDTLNSVYGYDPLQNHWEKLAEMQERRSNFSVVVLDEKIYAIGGFCDPEHIDSVEQFCPTANAWSFTSSLDLPLSGHMAKFLKGKIYMSGGKNSDFASLASMILYHPETGSTYLSNMTTARAHHCMETLGECLYVAGGITTDNNINIVDQLACEMYNPAADSWTVFASLPVPHVGAGSVVLEGKFYVLGGYSQEDYSDTKMVHRYDPTIRKWENMGKMPGPNNDIRAAVLSLPPHLRL
ncbi:kelch-like protein 13 [Channa argus]|uniref:kelch-like protein 13 n=1 Tax=Channa argus TaxID=215402 RepID=UPI002947B1F5|nr:hypothetical protein Q8A73_013093 [Channa argus]